MRGYNIAVHDVPAFLPAFFKRDMDGRALDFRPVRPQWDRWYPDGMLITTWIWNKMANIYYNDIYLIYLDELQRSQIAYIVYLSQIDGYFINMCIYIYIYDYINVWIDR